MGNGQYMRLFNLRSLSGRLSSLLSTSTGSIIPARMERSRDDDTEHANAEQGDVQLRCADTECLFVKPQAGEEHIPRARRQLERIMPSILA